MPVPSYDPTSYEPTRADPATTPFGDSPRTPRRERRRSGRSAAGAGSARRRSDAPRKTARRTPPPRPRWGARWRRIRTPRTVSFLIRILPGPRGARGRAAERDRAPRRHRGGGRAGAPARWAGSAGRAHRRDPALRARAPDASRTRRVRGCPTSARRRADAAAAMSSAAAAAAAAAAHHHQAAAASTAFAYESAIAALGALVDRGAPAGGDIGIRGVDDGARGGDGGDRHGHPGGVSVPRPVRPGRPCRGGAPIGRGPSASASAAGCGPPRGPRRRRERRRAGSPAPGARAHGRAGRRGALPGEPRRPSWPRQRSRTTDLGAPARPHGEIVPRRVHRFLILPKNVVVLYVRTLDYDILPPAPHPRA